MRAAKSQALHFSEDQGVRYLHFGTPWIQGAMRIRVPHRLVLDYTQDMMAWLMLMSVPDRVLHLGLGAGACVRFFGHYFPRCQQTVVELHKEVILANELVFGVRAHQDLRIIQADAKQWIKTLESDHWPLLLVDLYDANAKGPSCDGPRFYQHCYRALASPGLLVVNLFGSHPSWQPNLLAISKTFKTEPLVLTAGSAGNVVVIVAKGPRLQWPAHQQASALIDQLARRARLITRQLKLPAQRWIEPMQRYLNPSPVKKPSKPPLGGSKRPLRQTSLEGPEICA